MCLEPAQEANYGHPSPHFGVASDAYLGAIWHKCNRHAIGEGERMTDLLGRIAGRLNYKALVHDEEAEEVREAPDA